MVTKTIRNIGHGHAHGQGHDMEGLISGNDPILNNFIWKPGFPFRHQPMRKTDTNMGNE